VNTVSPARGKKERKGWKYGSHRGEKGDEGKGFLLTKIERLAKETFIHFANSEDSRKWQTFLGESTQRGRIGGEIFVVRRRWPGAGDRKIFYVSGFEPQE